MIVQYILKARMGTRELEDDEVDPSSFEVPREVMNKYGRGPLPPRTQIEADIINLKSEKERRKSINQSFDGTKENEIININGSLHKMIFLNNVGIKQ